MPQPMCTLCWCPSALSQRKRKGNRENLGVIVLITINSPRTIITIPGNGRAIRVSSAMFLHDLQPPQPCEPIRTGGARISDN